MQITYKPKNKADFSKQYEFITQDFVTNFNDKVNYVSTKLEESCENIREKIDEGICYLKEGKEAAANMIQQAGQWWKEKNVSGAICEKAKAVTKWCQDSVIEPISIAINDSIHKGKEKLMSNWCNSVGKDYGVGTDMLTTVSKSEEGQASASNSNSTIHVENQAKPVWKTSEFWNNVGVGMAGVLTTAAIIVAAAVFIVGTGGIGPLLLGILGVGTITVGAVAANDVNRNKVSSTNTYLGTGLFSSLAGATIGYIVGGPLVSSAIAQAGIITQGASYGASKGSSTNLNANINQGKDLFRNAYFKKDDLKMVNDAANQVGIDRKEFGNYIHEVKKDLGMKANQNFTFQELIELAEEYLNMIR